MAWRRLRACLEVGIAGTGQAGYVFSVNIARRQLGKGQAASCAQSSPFVRQRDMKKPLSD
jgi:hypothetical protein